MIGYLFTRADMERLYTSGWLRGLTLGADDLAITEVHAQLETDRRSYFKVLDVEEQQEALQKEQRWRRVQVSARSTGALPDLPDLSKRRRWFGSWFQR